jgi:glycosyltransferase involved in cell wall biosynthesis/Tfp pilus assembly protein PilF
MIVRNEATRLGRCLESVSALEPEIVVVDTGSTDGTREVAQSFGARVISFPWQDDFSAARNRSLKEARGRWILVLDADEAIATDDLPKLRKLLASPRAAAYRMVIRNYSKSSNVAGWQPCGGEYPVEEEGLPGWFPTAKVRLFRRHPSVRFEGLVHEVVGPSIERLKGKVASCPVPVHHFGLIGEDSARSKGRYYLRLCLGKVRSEPDEPVGWFEVASHLYKLGRYRWARRAFERTVELGSAKPHPSEAFEKIVVQALNMLGVLALAGDEVSEAIGFFERALQINPSFEPCKRNKDEAQKRLSAAKVSHQGPVSSQTECAVSLCMIVKDEEDNLAGCLESFGHVADQIVVVDTGSTDGTPELARRYGAEVYHHPWRDDFSEARNWSLHYARGRMIFWADADDRLESGTAETFRRELLANEGKAVYFLIRSPEPEGTVLRAYQLRAFPNRPSIRFEGRIHEQVIWSVQNQKIPSVHLPLEIVHTGYVDGEALHGKLLRNRRILEDQIHQDPDNLHSQYMLARTLEGMKEPEEAAVWLRRVTDHQRARSERNEFVFHAQALLAVYECNRGELEVGRKLLEELLVKAPGFAFGRLCMGQLALNTGHPLEACQVLLPLVENELKPSLIPMGNPVQEAYRYLGAALMELGRWQEARGCLEKALELNGEDQEARFRLGDCLLQEGLLDEAEQAFRACNGSNPNVRFKLGTVALGRKDLDRAEEHLKFASQAGLDTAALHHNLGYLMAQKGDWEEAEGHYRLALERQPDMIEPLLNMGHGLLSRSRWAEAEGFFQKALAVKPELLDARLAAAALAFGRGGPEAKNLASELWHELTPTGNQNQPLPSKPTDLFISFGQLFEDQGQNRLSRLCQQLAVNLPY